MPKLCRDATIYAIEGTCGRWRAQRGSERRGPGIRKRWGWALIETEPGARESRAEGEPGRGPRLTIGVPVYNGARFLGEALETILGQSFEDFEVIVSDNASTDGTPEVAGRFARKDSRVRVLRNETNVGLSANFNRLVPLARGSYFKWATADDALCPTYLERCIEVLEADASVVLAYTRARFVDGSGNEIEREDRGWHLVEEDPAARLRYVIRSGHLVNSVLGVIRCDALRATRLLPKYPGGDYGLLGELSLMGKFVEVPEPLYVRRIHPASSNWNAGDTAWIRRYFGGAGRGAGSPYWHLCRDHALTILRSSLPFRQRCSLLLFLLDVMKLRRARLFRELGSLIRLRGF